MRHRRMVAPINSVKHYVHRTNAEFASGAASSLTLVNSVVAPATGTAADVKEGSIVKAIHLEYWLQATGATDTNCQFIVIIYKAPSAVDNISAAELLNLGAWDNKKNILYSTQGVLGAGIDGNQAVAVLRNWLLIPKGKQRFGLADRLVVSFEPVGTTMNICGLATYKEYT